MFKNAVDLPNDEFWEKAIRCYSCHEIHTLKIFYCENSHFLCHRCSRCECGSRPTRTRATFLENIVRKTRYGCENNCGLELTNDEYAYHVEEACRCRPVECVFCKLKQKYADYLHHLKRIHNIPRVKLDDRGSAFIKLTEITTTLQHVEFQEKDFFIRWRFSKFWVQCYQNCSGYTVRLEGADSFEQSLKPSRLLTLFRDIQSVSLPSGETFKITFSGSDLNEAESSTKRPHTSYESNNNNNNNNNRL